ncbi:protein max isoform X1 [Ovis canadensis]|uniref:protein max isoform X1 n=1 Tax=Ovis canadensis TaxID=37174 RepID=UPI0037521E12
MSDNDDIEVESDVSPGASSFPCGLSGWDSGRGSQQGDGGRGPGSRRLLPLPPLGRDPSRSRLARSGLLAGAAFWDWRKSNRGFNLRLTNGLITMHWNGNAGTTSKTAFTVCGTRSPHSKERSPCTGEGEVECPTADQLPLLRQQPLHQRQGQHHLCLRWGLGLQLGVGARRAPKQEEAPDGGQLSSTGQASNKNCLLRRLILLSVHL